MDVPRVGANVIREIVVDADEFLAPVGGCDRSRLEEGFRSAARVGMREQDQHGLCIWIHGHAVVWEPLTAIVWTFRSGTNVGKIPGPLRVRRNLLIEHRWNALPAPFLRP